MAPPALPAPPGVARARHRRAPGARGAHPGDRAGAGAPRLARVRAASRRRAVEREPLTAVHPRALRRGDRGALPRAGGGRDRRRHGRASGSCEAALRAAGGAVRAGRRCCWPAGAPGGVQRAAPARATTPSPRGRWGSACSTTSPWPRGARVDAHGLSRVLIARLGRAPRQRDQRRSSTPIPTCCSSRSTSGRCIRAPARRGRRARARARATRSTCRCRRGRATRSSSRCVEHVVAPLARAYAPELVLSRRASTRTATTRSPTAGDRGRLRGDDGGGAAARGGARRAVGLVLEGGYDLGALARSMAATLEVLAADEVPDAGSAPPDPLAVHAAARLNRWWPTLGGAEARSAS